MELMLQRLVSFFLCAVSATGDYAKRLGKALRSKPARRLAAAVMSLCLVVNLLPMTAFSAESEVPPAVSGVCGHVHNEECGYIEAVEGVPCSHQNEHGSYSCAPILDSDDISDNDATPSDADYVCDHSDGCGYVEAVEGADCTHSCELCDPPEETLPEETPTVENPPKPEETTTDTCICDTLCTEDSINLDCPVCSAENADLSLCIGAEEEKASAYEEVVALFAALPSADSITEETTEEQLDELMAQINAALDALNALSDEDFAKFTEEHSDLLAAVQALQTAIINDTPTLLADAPTPTVYNKEISANGIPLILAAGESDSTKTVIYIDSDSDGTVSEGDTIFKPGDSANGTTEGNDLSTYSIYGGTRTRTVNSTSITMTGGKVNKLYGGGGGLGIVSGGTVTDMATVKISGGTVVNVFGGGYSNNTVGSVSITMTGGTVGFVSGGSDNALASVAGTVDITVTGGTVRSNIQGDGNGGEDYSLSVTVGGSAKIGEINPGSGIVINGGTGTPVTVGVDSFKIDPDFSGTDGSVCVYLTEGYDVSANPVIATEAVEADVAKIQLVGQGAMGKEAYFDSGTIRVRTAASAAVEITRDSSTTKYTTLANAIENAQDSDTLKIIANIDLGETGVEISGKTLTLDLNGNTITYSGTGEKSAITLLNDRGTGLTVTDSSTGKHGKLQATGDSGRAILISSANATVKVEGGTVSATTGNAIFNNNTGTVIVSGGTVSATGTFGYAINNNSGGTINVSGGTVSAMTGRAIYNALTGTVTVSGGEVSATTGYAIYNGDQGGTVTISGGTVSATGASGKAIYNYGIGKITINGNAKVTSANTVPDSGTIHLNAVPTGSGDLVVLDIQGGTVENTATPTAGYAVYFKTDGTGVTSENINDYYTQGTNAEVGKVYPEATTTAVPTVDTNVIYANGAALIIAADGTGTTIYVDENRDGMLDTDKDKSLKELNITNAPSNGADLSLYTIYGGGNTDMTGNTKITMTGGNVKYIYGGGYSNKVTGNTEIVMSGGTVTNSVFGGGDGSGEVSGNTSVTIGKDAAVSSIYGGGSGREAVVGMEGNQNTVMVTVGGNVNYVYGGSGSGTVNGNVSVIIKEEATVNGAVYGSGRANNSVVNGDTFVTVAGTVNGAVYGCGSQITMNGKIEIKITGTVGDQVTGSSGSSTGNSKANLIIGSGAKVGEDSWLSGVRLNTLSDSCFAIEQTLANDDYIFVNLPSGIVDGSTIATGAVEADLAKITLVGQGAAGKEAYFENDEIKVRTAATAVPTVDGTNIYANGTEIRVVAGTGQTSGVQHTNILYDVNKDGIIGDMEYLKIGDNDATAAGYDLSTYIIYGGGNTNLTGNTKITMTGGNVNYIYGGGGNNTKVTGSAEIVMSGGTVKQSVYGGSSGGAVTGSTKVTISEAATVVGNVYGGSNGSSSVVGTSGSGNTVTVTVAGKANYVYGGGLGGVVNGNVSVIIREAAMVDRNIYGGGNVSNVVNGDTSVTVAGTVKGIVYGCGNTSKVNGDISIRITGTVGNSVNGKFGSSIVTGKITLTIGGGAKIGEEGSWSGVQLNALSDSCFAIEQTLANDAYIYVDLPSNIADGSTIATGAVAGDVDKIKLVDTSAAGREAYFENGEIKVRTTVVPTVSGQTIYAKGAEIKIVAGTGETDGIRHTNILYDADKNGTIEDTEYLKIGSTEPTGAGYDLHNYVIYGGGNGALAGNTKITMTGGNVNYIYGGNNSNNVTGNTEITMTDGNVNYIYGGNNSNNVTGNTKITMTGGNVNYIYGGNYSNNVNGNTEIVISGGEVKQFLYGGGLSGAVTGSTSVTIGKDATVSAVYGGNGSSGTVGTENSGNTVTVTVAGTAGSVCGGGSRGTVNGNISVTIQEGATVTGDVYGGGQAGSSAVNGDISVTVAGEVKSNVHGCGSGCTVNGKIDIKITGTVGYKVEGSYSSNSVTGKNTLTIGGGAKVGNGGLWSGVQLETLSDSRFAIQQTLGNDAYIYVYLPGGYDASANPVIATGAVTGDVAKIKLVGNGAAGKEAYFDNGEIKVRASSAVVELLRGGTMQSKYNTLSDAITAAQGGDTLKILNNITLSSGVQISGKSLILDLNGQTVTYSGVYNAITLGNNASLTVTDGGTGGKLEATGEAGVVIGNESAGTVTVTGGTVTTVNENGAAIWNYSTGKVDVSGGTVSATGTSGPAIYNESTGKITISGDAVVTSRNTLPGTIYLQVVPQSNPKIVLEITGGTVENTAANGCAVYFHTLGTGVTSANVKDYYTVMGSATVGKVHPEPLKGVELLRGGTTQGKYDTLADAINAAETGDTLKILNNITLSSGVQISGKNLTLDLNGQTVTYSGSGSGGKAITLSNNANLTVTDGGSGGKLESGGTAIWNESTGTVTVKGGTVSAANGDGTAIVNFDIGEIKVEGGTVSAVNGNGPAILNFNIGEIKVEGGTVSAVNGNSAAILNNYTGTVTVKGGRVSLVNGNSAAILNCSQGEIKLEGGTVSATGRSGKAILNVGSGKITISGSAVVTSENTSTEYGTIYLDAVPNPAAVVLEISGGSVNNTETNGYAVYFDAAGVTADNLGSYYSHTGGTVGRVHPEPATITPTVTSVSVSPNPATVQKGGTQQFTAIVSGTNNPAQTVSWSLSGAEKPGTSISTGGLLTVAADETAATLTVTATSTVDATKGGTATVTVQTDVLTDEQKLAMAKSAIEEALVDLTVSNTTTAQDILSAANAATLYNVTVAWDGTDGFSKTEATANANGFITGTLNLTLGSASGTVTVSKVIDRLPADKSALTTAIAAANSAKNGVVVRDLPASSVANGTKFVTTAEMEALNNAITAAQTVMDNDSATDADITAAVSALNSAVAAFHDAIKTGTYTGGSSGSGSGSGGGGGLSSGSSGGSPTVTPSTGTKPGTPTESKIKAEGTMDENGGITVNLSEKAVEDAIKAAEDEARTNGSLGNGIVLVINIINPEGAGRTADSVTVNLPKTTQETIIRKNIVNTVIVVDDPGIQIGIDLAAVTSINMQANADVNITATRLSAAGLTETAKAAIGTRPVFDLRANYGGGRQVTQFGNGSVSVAIPYALAAGESAGGVYAVYVDANGDVQWLGSSVYDGNTRVLRFSTNHFSTYGVGYKAPAGFTDIAGHWAKDDIQFVVNRGLLSGTSATTFSPNTAMTRGMFVTALGRLAGADVSGYKQSSFTDVKADAYYMGYVEWAAKNGILQGTTATTFAPDNAVTREQMAVIMANYAKAIGFSLPKAHAQNTFADAANISPWATDSVKSMQMAGVLAGKNANRFDPQGTATRAEAAATLRRFVELMIDASTTQGWMYNDDGQWMYYENGSPVKNTTRNVDGEDYSFDACGVTLDFPKKKAGYGTYTVQAGDNFWKIARKHNVDMYTLAEINGKTIYSVIYPGDELKIPE